MLIFNPARPLSPAFISFALAGLALACGEDVERREIPFEPQCENLDDVHCGLPWPSDRWLVDDPTSDTGVRLRYDPAGLPSSSAGVMLETEPFDRLDGFSPSSQLVAAFETPADLTGVGGFPRLADSTQPSFPTVLIDLETGERVAHWIENDLKADANDATILFIRPGTRLEPNRRYGVAIHGLRDVDGELIEAPEGFATLRDGAVSQSESFNARRQSYEALFTALEGAGVARASLQLAWWFHTESFESSHRELLSMRNDALERLGDQGLGCTINAVDMIHEGTARRIRGTMTTPFYLDEASPPSALVRDADGLPAFVQNREVDFTAVVPEVNYADDATPARLIVFGHGLLGSGDGYVQDRQITAWAAERGMLVVATDWAGMNSNVIPFLGTALSDPSKFYMIGENLQQAMINFIALTRGMIGSCRLEDAFMGASASVVDPSRASFLGGSQGATLGATLVSLSPDFDRAVLTVGGTAYSAMLDRSTEFSQYDFLLTNAFRRRLDNALLVAMSQHVWDRAESATWLRYTREGVAGLPGRDMLWVVTSNDAQVPFHTAHRAARLGNLPVLSQSTQIPLGTQVVDSPHAGSGFISFNLGDRAVPEGNLPPAEDDGGHAGVAFTPEASQMILDYFETGVIDVRCDGVCDLTD